MMFGRLFIAATLAAALTGSVHSTSEPDIGVSVILDRDTIGMDEQATLIIEVTGTSQDLPNPQIPTLPKFEVYSQGHSTNISIVNGQVTASVTHRYLLLPSSAGTFPIDQISVVYKNKRYKGNRVELTVLSKGRTANKRLEEKAIGSAGLSRDYFLEASIDNKTPYVGEQVTLTLKFLIAVQYFGSPELTEPTRTGFWTELLGNKAPYYQRLRDRRYKVIERKYALFPTRTGDLTIGRATIRTTVADRGKRYRDPFDVLGGFFGRGVEVSASSQPIRINVKPLPDKGRPPDFTGTVGDFKISVRLNRKTVEVNQPVTVAITISGTGNIKSVADPIYADDPDFRIYRASTKENLSKPLDRIVGSKIFEEVFIPNRPGQLEIPSISFNYFNPRLRKYRTVSSRPIRIDVTKPEGYAGASDIPYTTPDLTIGSRASDIRFIKQDIGDVRSKGEFLLTTPLYLLVNGVPVILLAGTIFVNRRRRRLAADVGYARSRAASREARKRLSRARSLASVEKETEFFAEITKVLTSYVADMLNISPLGLTSDSIKSALHEKGADLELIEGVLNVMKQSDFARFAPGSLKQEDIDTALRQTEDIIIRLEGVSFV